MNDVLPKKIQKLELDDNIFVVDLDTILFITLVGSIITIGFYSEDSLVIETETPTEELRAFFLNLYTKFAARRNSTNTNTMDMVLLQE